MFKEENKTPIIEVKNLTKSFGKKNVLDDVSFNLYENEVLLIVGFSGTGKSTLLKLICGLEESDSGDVILRTTEIGMVFQSAALFDSMNIFENVTFPLINNKNINQSQLEIKVKEKLKLVGLSGIESLRPDQLSGGMRKRVSFARAIINDPKVILYDEPTSGLDPVVSNIIVDYILKLQNELSASSILVTHHLELIRKMNSRLILLYEGKIVWQGNSNDFVNSNDPYAIQFIQGNPQGPMKVIKN